MTDTPETPLLTMGVVADTHVPDRLRNLHPGLLPALRAAGVARILHAGDVCAPVVLDELATVAPVTAVRGNRDLTLRHLPLVQRLDVEGVPLALTHGHGGFWNYLRDKWRYMRDGYRFERFQYLLPHLAPWARVIVFGHTHYPENVWDNDRLLFNPGSAGWNPLFPRPSYGLLHFYPGGRVVGEILALDGARLVNWRWMAAG